MNKCWRRVALDQLKLIPGEKYLNVATGTGDMSIEITKRDVPGVHVTATDFSQNMIDFGEKKIKKIHFENMIKFHLADGENLPFEDNSFHSAVCAFGVRNFSDRFKGIKEMTRVIKENGRIVILEFSNPENRFFRFLYYFYFKKMLPLIGGLISGRFSAYRYLPDSVLNFHSQEELKLVMEKAGLKKINYFTLTFGIVTVHTGYK